MNKSLNKIAVIMLAAFLIFGCAKSNALEPGDKAPDFNLVDLDGKQVSLAGLTGKVVILDFFASWCPPCRQEIPDFIKLQGTYASKGFTVIGVALVGRNEAKDFASQIGINYPVALDDGKITVAYGPVRSIPTTFVIDKDAKIKKVYIGFRPKEVFENDIKELLQ